MKKALLVGDITNPSYHPFGGVSRELTKILDTFECTITEEYGAFSLDQLRGYDLCVFYFDRWATRGSRQSAVAILQYITNGGAAIFLHCGLVLGTSFELQQAAGAAFKGHPEARTLHFSDNVQLGELAVHPIMEGFEPFDMEDEPYQFHTDPNILRLTPNQRLLMVYDYNKVIMVAGWCRLYGLGRVVSLAPGHSEKQFQNKHFAALLRRSALWCAGDL